MKSHLNSKQVDLDNPEPDTRVWRQMIEHGLKTANTSANDSHNGSLQAQQEARVWLTGEGDVFKLVCALAGMTPDKVRNETYRWAA
ncbi:MAG: hypothetical protein HQL52_15640 [Magnetococcales bacterium]|nr:hypothetical protein [Magnetococcales bacterium]